MPVPLDPASVQRDIPAPVFRRKKQKIPNRERIEVLPAARGARCNGEMQPALPMKSVHMRGALILSDDCPVACVVLQDDSDERYDKRHRTNELNERKLKQTNSHGTAFELQQEARRLREKQKQEESTQLVHEGDGQPNREGPYSYWPRGGCLAAPVYSCAAFTRAISS